MDDKATPRAQNSLGLGNIKINATMTVEDAPKPPDDKKSEERKPYDAEKE